MKAFEVRTLVPGCKFRGNLEAEVDTLNLVDRRSETSNTLTYVVGQKYIAIVQQSSNITCLILSPEDASTYEPIMLQKMGCIIISDKPEITFYLLHEALVNRGNFYRRENGPAKIGKNCRIHNSAVVDVGVSIGDNVSIGPQTVIKRGTSIGSNVVIGCSTVIGSEGFQVVKVKGAEPLRITHVGGVIISDNVFVGDNTCIANSLFDGATFIGKGAKIDNLVHVAHNTYVGDYAVLTAQVTLCGSAIIKESAWIGPNSSILNKVVVGRGATVGLGSVVTRDVEPGTTVYGVPAKPNITKT